MGPTWQATSLVLVLVAGCKFEPGTLGGRDDGGGPGSDAALDDATPPPGPDAAVDAPDDAPAPPVDGSALACPLSYMLTNNAAPASRYRHETASATWAAAESDCEDDDANGTFRPAHLVVMDDAAERQWVYDQGTTDKWVGVTDVNTEGVLQAVTDQANPYFGTPSSQQQSRDCMVVNQTETVMESCGQTFQYICECDGEPANADNY